MGTVSFILKYNLFCCIINMFVFIFFFLWCNSDDDSPDQKSKGDNSIPGLHIGSNPFLDTPQNAAAIEYKKGYVMRKCCFDSNYKKSEFLIYHLNHTQHTHNNSNTHIHKHVVKNHQSVCLCAKMLHIHLCVDVHRLENIIKKMLYVCLCYNASLINYVLC